MKKGKGHGKGSSFERKIAKEIVKAFRKPFGMEQRDCWRSVLSGGHAMSAGDLRMSRRMEELFPYAVECKHYRKIKLENFMVGNPNSKEVKWLEQTIDGAKKSNGLRALLVMKANNQKILTMRLLSHDERKRLGNFICVQDTFWKMNSWSFFLKRAVEHAKKRMKGKWKSKEATLSRQVSPGPDN